MEKTADYINNRSWVEAKTAWINAFETAKTDAGKARLATNIAWLTR